MDELQKIQSKIYEIRGERVMLDFITPCQSPRDVLRMNLNDVTSSSD